MSKNAMSLVALDSGKILFLRRFIFIMNYYAPAAPELTVFVTAN